MLLPVNTYTAANEDALSRTWGRQFLRVIAVQQRSNTIIELEERGIDQPVRRFLRLARSPGWSDEEINWELSLLRSIPTELSMAVARPLPGADGQYLQRQNWDGEARCACLFEVAWAPGI